MNITREPSKSENSQNGFYSENKDLDDDFCWEISKAIKTTLGPSGMEKVLKKVNTHLWYHLPLQNLGFLLPLQLF